MGAAADKAASPRTPPAALSFWRAEPTSVGRPASLPRGHDAVSGHVTQRFPIKSPSSARGSPARHAPLRLAASASPSASPASYTSALLPEAARAERLRAHHAARAKTEAVARAAAASGEHAHNRAVEVARARAAAHVRRAVAERRQASSSARAYDLHASRVAKSSAQSSPRPSARDMATSASSPQLQRAVWGERVRRGLRAAWSNERPPPPVLGF